MLVITYTYTTTWGPRWLTQEPVLELRGNYSKVLSPIFIYKEVLIKIFLQQTETLICTVKFHKKNSTRHAPDKQEIEL